MVLTTLINSVMVRVNWRIKWRPDPCHWQLL